MRFMVPQAPLYVYIFAASIYEKILLNYYLFLCSGWDIRLANNKLSLAKINGTYIQTQSRFYTYVIKLE